MSALRVPEELRRRVREHWQTLREYDPAQPRVPAGSPEGGEWTAEGSESVAASIERKFGARGAKVSIGSTPRSLALARSFNLAWGTLPSETRAMYRDGRIIKQIRFAEQPQPTGRWRAASAGFETRTKTITFYGKTQYNFFDKYDPKMAQSFKSLNDFVGTIIHESGHALAELKAQGPVFQTSIYYGRRLQEHFDKQLGWRTYYGSEGVLDRKDGLPVSKYAWSNRTEDFAEAWRQYQQHPAGMARASRVRYDLMDKYASVLRAYRRAHESLHEYSPDQPRVPAGSPEGGEWTSADDGGGGGQVRVADLAKFSAEIAKRNEIEARLRQFAVRPPGETTAAQDPHEMEVHVLPGAEATAQRVADALAQAPEGVRQAFRAGGIWNFTVGPRAALIHRYEIDYMRGGASQYEAHLRALNNYAETAGIFDYGDRTLWIVSEMLDQPTFREDRTPAPWLNEVLVHEIGHSVYNNINVKAQWRDDFWYENGRPKQGYVRSITAYGSNNAAEDFAESWAHFWLNREHLRTADPKRYDAVRTVVQYAKFHEVKDIPVGVIDGQQRYYPMPEGTYDRGLWPEVPVDKEPIDALPTERVYPDPGPSARADTGHVRSLPVERLVYRQRREDLDGKKVVSMARALIAGEKMDPIEVTDLGRGVRNRWLVTDGHHRTAAHAIANRSHVLARISTPWSRRGRPVGRPRQAFEAGPPDEPRVPAGSPGGGQWTGGGAPERISKAELPDTFYVGIHGDWWKGYEGRPGIQRVGMNPAAKPKGAIAHTAPERMIYLATTPERAAAYASLYSRPMVLRVDGKQLDDLFYRDPDDVTTRMGPKILQVRYAGTIPAHAISVWTPPQGSVVAAQLQPREAAADEKPTVVLDFDGVIHQHADWKGEDKIEGDPMPGAQKAISDLRKRYKVIVLSARSATLRGQQAIEEWLKRHGIEVDGVSATKPPAIAYVDDRAVPFGGDWSKIGDRVAAKEAFDPDQPRVPAGSPDGGEWTSGGVEGYTMTVDGQKVVLGKFGHATATTDPWGKPLDRYAAAKWFVTKDGTLHFLSAQDFHDEVAGERGIKGLHNFKAIGVVQLDGFKYDVVALAYDSSSPVAVERTVKSAWRAIEPAFEPTREAFNPDQPRVPAGNPDGGQWTGTGDGGAEDGSMIISQHGIGRLFKGSGWEKSVAEAIGRKYQLVVQSPKQGLTGVSSAVEDHSELGLAMGLHGRAMDQVLVVVSHPDDRYERYSETVTVEGRFFNPDETYNTAESDKYASRFARALLPYVDPNLPIRYINGRGRPQGSGVTTTLAGLAKYSREANRENGRRFILVRAYGGR